MVSLVLEILDLVTVECKANLTLSAGSLYTLSSFKFLQRMGYFQDLGEQSIILYLTPFDVNYLPKSSGFKPNENALILNDSEF